MLVSLTATTPCLLCGYQLRVITFGTARVNRRSVRVKTGITAIAFRDCPECGTSTYSALMPRSAYVTDPQDLNAIRVARARRWPELQETA